MIGISLKQLLLKIFQNVKIESIYILIFMG